MFVDWVSLLLVNMVAGLLLLATYVYWGLDDPDQKRWAPGFAMVGLVGLLFGGAMTLMWPLPGPYSAAFGEMSVLLGVTFLGAALALAQGWDLAVLSLYALFPGACAILVGIRILDLGLTAKPILSGPGFVLTGMGGLFAAPTLAYLKGNRLFRTLAALLLLAAAGIWALTAASAYWMHLKMWADWKPLVLQAPPGH